MKVRMTQSSTVSASRSPMDNGSPRAMAHASRSAVDLGKEQPPLRHRVGARQGSHLLLEMLVGQDDTQPGRVIAEKLTDLFERFAVVGGEGA